MFYPFHFYILLLLMLLVFVGINVCIFDTKLSWELVSWLALALLIFCINELFSGILYFAI